MHMPHFKLGKLIKPSTASWDYYYCLVDNKPAIISVDLNLVEVVPDTALPNLFYISIKIKSPSTEGFPSPAELTSLCKLEDEILDVLIPATVARFCGRVTTSGTRDLIFYVNDVIGTQSLVEKVMAMESYTYECGSKEDSEWDFYVDFLFPNERELNAIYNTRYTAELNKEGDNPQQERSVKHILYFPNEDHRDQFLIKIIDEYFQVEKIEKLPAETKNRWKTTISRSDCVDINSINTLTLHLLDLAKKHQGMYEGWETIPVRMYDGV